ncbi:MAG: sulfite exporter TauE/SafE family protein [bacterium]
MPEPAILALMGLIVLGAFVAKGATGFGESLLIVPLFLLFLDIKVALPVVLITTFGADIYMLYHHHRDVQWRGLAVMIAAAVVGVVGGTLLFQQLQSGLLKTVFAAFVLLFAVRMLLTRNRKVTTREPNPIYGFVSGGTAGFIDALLGTGGPPLIIYLSWLGLGKTPFRATFILLAFALHLVRVTSYAATGLFTRQIVLTGLCLLVPMILGAMIGRKLHDRLNETLFQRIAAVVLLIIGVKLLL